MLKACWDCLMGVPVPNQEVYGTQLNGDTLSAPPWPEPQLENETMFVLPKRLSDGHKIKFNITLLNNPGTLTISLLTGNNSPDYQNIACHFQADFRNDSMVTKIIHNGFTVEEIPHSERASDLFTESNFDFQFDVAGNGSILNIFIDASNLDLITLKHNVGDIRYLSVSGDVQKVNSLQFQF